MRGRYLRDRASRRGERYGRRDRHYYPMDYRGNRAERGYSRDIEMRGDRYYPERYDMGYERPYERNRMGEYDMNYDYRGRRDYRDYANEDYDKEYHDDLMEWIKKLKKDDRYGLSKEQVINKAREMGVAFKDFDEDEFYAIYLMHVSDYPFIANEPHTYLAMAKAWLEDSDLEIDPDEKVCKYLYEIVMADE